MINVSHCVYTIYMALSLDAVANTFFDRTHRLYDEALLTRCFTQLLFILVLILK